MKLKLNRTLRAALIAAITAVGFTLTQAQAADTTLANIMNQGQNTIIWGDSGADLTEASATCTTANVRSVNAYENSFRAVDTNVGSSTADPVYTYTLTFTTGESVDATLSKVTADFLTFNGSNAPHNATNYINVAWTLNGGEQSLAGTSSNVELLFRSTATGGTAGYTSSGEGETLTFDTSDSSHYCGGTAIFDFTDFSLAANTEYTLTIGVTRVTTTGFFAGIGNIALINTVADPTSTWKGTEGHNNWNDEGAWDPAFSAGNVVVFGSDGCDTTLLTDSVQVAKVTVNESHTLDMQTGGVLNIGSDGIVIAQDKTFSLANNAGTTYAVGAVSGAGDLALTAGTFTIGNIGSTGKLVVTDNGTLELGNGSYTLPTFEISNGGVVTTTRSDGTGCVTGDIHILGGGTFKVVGGHDAFGYNGGQTDNIYLKGDDAQHLAILSLEQNNTTNSVTMQTNLYLLGYASIVSKANTKGFNTYGCSISAEGVQNTIALMDLRNNVTIDVAESGSLEIAKVTKNGNGSKIITKTGEGTLSFTGDALMNGLNVDKGTVAFTGGTSTVDALSLTSNGTLRISGNGTVVNIGGANSTISSTIQVDAGTLNLTGSFAIDGIPSAMQISWKGAEDAGNGFKTSTGEIHVYNATNGGTVTIADSGHITYGGADVKGSLNNGVYSAQGVTDYTSFYVNTAGTTELVSKAYSDSHTPGKFILAANTGLKVDQSVTATVTGSGDSSVVTIESDRVLTGTAQNVEIAGTGTYALSNGTTTLGTNVSLDDGWTGTVRISNAGSDSSKVGSLQNVLSALSNSGKGVVEVNNVVGWLGDNVSTNIKLTGTDDGGIGTALRIADGSSGQDRVFSGTITGAGDFEYSWTGGSGQEHTFSGDIAGWTGSFKDTGTGTSYGNVEFSGSATEINASVLHGRNSDMTLTFTNDNSVIMNGSISSTSSKALNVQANASVTFGQDVAATSLTVGAGKTATFNGTATFDSVNGTGKVVVGEDSTLTVSGTVGSDVQIDAADGATIDADLDTTQVGIAANATASFVQGVADVASGVSFQNEGETPAPVTVENTSADEVLHYNIGAENATVTADTLVAYTEGQSPIEVKNQVVVDTVTNMGEASLILTHVDTEKLTSVYAGADITLQNVNANPVVLSEMGIAEGTTVAAYTQDLASVEGSITIQETLAAGGGTLLANLTLVSDSTLDLSLMDGGRQALTLGSALTFDFSGGSGSHVNLDEATIAALGQLQDGEKLALIVAKEETELTYGGNDYDGMSYSDLFNRADGLVGDYKVYANGAAFGLMKSTSPIPEPTTGTLSLLALAALAARRRRK